MTTWLWRLRNRANRTGALPTSEFHIDEKTVLEATSAHVILNLFDRTNKRGMRSKWDRVEVEKIHAALGRWLATGSLDQPAGGGE